MNLKKLNSKKAIGADIIGIAVLFVIIILGLVFYIGIKVFEKPSSPQKEYVSSKFAYDVVDVVLRTNSEAGECNGLSFKDIIQDCASSPESTCGTAGTTTKCSYAKEKINTILNTHLKTQEGLDYYFEISSGSTEEDASTLTWNIGETFKFNSTETDSLKNPKTCSGNRRSKVYQIPNLRGESIFLRMDICI